MQKVHELIQRVQNLYSKGTPSDDSRLRPRHIFNKLVSVRARLTSQKSNKNQRISQWSYQALSCVELIKAPIHECPCLPTGKCIILRSKYRLPKPILNLSSELIKSVTTIDGAIVFNQTSFDTFKYQKGNKYTGNKPSWYVRDGYLYITNNTILEVVSIIGLFESPEAVWEFPSFCKGYEDCGCESYLDKDFPIDGDLVEPTIELAVQELVQIFSQMREDESNNSKDSTIEESK
jgi:hypothetical protein